MILVSAAAAALISLAAQSAAVSVPSATPSSVPAAPNSAGGAADRALVRCLINAITPADRQSLARWEFYAMAQNAAVQADAPLTPAKLAASDAAVTAIYSRLIFNDCRNETVADLRAQGRIAMRTPFRVIGEEGLAALVATPAYQRQLRLFSSRIEMGLMGGLLRESGVAMPAAPQASPAKASPAKTPPPRRPPA